MREPKRNRHGWRKFTAEEAANVVRFAKAEHPPSDIGMLLREAVTAPATVERLKKVVAHGL